jgi:hypothetical protein
MGVAAGAEEDQWRPVPGHLTVDRGADDNQVITAVGLPDAEVPGSGEYAEPGRAALRAPQHEWRAERNGRQRINGHTGRAAVRENGGDYPDAGGVLAKIARSGSIPPLARLAWEIVIAGPSLGIPVPVLALGESGWPGRKIHRTRK